MSVMSDRWIRQMAQQHGMIEPFVEAQSAQGVISYGVSSYGYDVRVADEFKIFTNVNLHGRSTPRISTSSFVDARPTSASSRPTASRWRAPSSISASRATCSTVCLGKSTYARCGIIVNVTPFEPEWEGYVTLEISNTTPLPAKIYANEGICQVLFLQGDEPCETSYADKAGKYMRQRGVALPKL